MKGGGRDLDVCRWFSGVFLVLHSVSALTVGRFFRGNMLYLRRLWPIRATLRNPVVAAHTSLWWKVHEILAEFLAEK